MPSIPKKQRKRPWTRCKRSRSDYGNEDQPFYNSSRWRKSSLFMRMEHPVCPVCETAYVEMTDHVIPMSLGGAALDHRNLLPLCHPCHNVKRGMETHRDEPMVEYRQTENGLVPVDKMDIIKILRDAKTTD